jgi:hypothetical protein
MDLENNIDYGFTIFEINIYEELNWDYDLIIKYLDYFRINFDRIANIERAKIEVYLIKVVNFIGQDYPAIGLITKNEDDIELLLNKLQINIERWIKQQGGINELLIEATNIEIINWEILKRIKFYPKIN